MKLYKKTAGANSYYRAVPKFLGYSIIFKPHGYYERVDEQGNLEYDSTTDSFAISDIPEIAASKYIGGALYGAYTAVHKDKYYVYEIDEYPDVDISQSGIYDFALIEEVRFRDSVNAKYIGEYSVSSDLKESIDNFAKAYEEDTEIEEAWNILGEKLHSVA